MLKYFYTLIVTSLLLAPVHAEQIKTTAFIRFHGTSTLHDFEGDIATIPFSANFHNDPLTGQSHVSAIAIVKVLEMTTHKKKRDKNMLQMLDAQHFDLITGVLENALAPEKEATTATLLLKICNVEKEVPVTLSDWNRNGDHVSFKMTFSISLKNFGLKGPSVLGLIRVGDTVELECTLEGAVQ